MGSKKAKGTGKRVKDHGVKVGANKVTKRNKKPYHKKKTNSNRPLVEEIWKMGQSRSDQRANNRGTRLREVEYERSDHSRGRTVIGYKTTKGLTTLYWVTEAKIKISTVEKGEQLQIT